MRPEDLGPRREADPELEDPDAGQAGGDEVAELVDEDERPEDEEEQEDRDGALEDLRHDAAPDRAGRVGGADLGVEGDERLEIRRLVGACAVSVDRRLEQARDAGEVEAPGEEPLDGDLVGGDQRGRRALPDPARLAGDPERRETGLVGRPEVEPAGRDEIDGRRTAMGGGRGR